MTGAASAFTGPGDGAGITYTLDDAAADYGSIAAGAMAFCTDCYAVSLAGDRTTIPVHSDATMQEDVTPVAPPAFGQPHLVTKMWTLHIGESFSDVSNDVGRGSVLPEDRDDPPQRRDGRLRRRNDLLPAAEHPAPGDGGVPAQGLPGLRLHSAGLHASGTVHRRRRARASTPTSIEDLKTRSITAGCGDGTTYCPDANVLRQEMAVFLLKTLLGGAYVPPACTPPGHVRRRRRARASTRTSSRTSRPAASRRAARRNDVLPDGPRHPSGDGGLPLADLQPRALRSVALVANRIPIVHGPGKPGPFLFLRIENRAALAERVRGIMDGDIPFSAGSSLSIKRKKERPMSRFRRFASMFAAVLLGPRGCRLGPDVFPSQPRDPALASPRRGRCPRPRRAGRRR